MEARSNSSIADSKGVAVVVVVVGVDGCWCRWLLVWMAVGCWSLVVCWLFVGCLLVVCWLFAATSNTFRIHHDAPFDVA